MDHKVEYTSGPWELETAETVCDNLREVYGEGEVIALVPDWKDSDPITADANARLIAAAPELYLALERLMLCLEAGLQITDEDLEKAALSLLKAKGEI